MLSTRLEDCSAAQVAEEKIQRTPDGKWIYLDTKFRGIALIRKRIMDSNNKWTRLYEVDVFCPSEIFDTIWGKIADQVKDEGFTVRADEAYDFRRKCFVASVFQPKTEAPVIGKYYMITFSPAVRTAEKTYETGTFKFANVAIRSVTIGEEVANYVRVEELSASDSSKMIGQLKTLVPQDYALADIVNRFSDNNVTRCIKKPKPADLEEMLESYSSVTAAFKKGNSLHLFSKHGSAPIEQFEITHAKGKDVGTQWVEIACRGADELVVSCLDSVRKKREREGSDTQQDLRL